MVSKYTQVIVTDKPIMEKEKIRRNKNETENKTVYISEYNHY